MKTCGFCKEAKPLSEFYNHRLSKDGKQTWCKPCQKLGIRNSRKTDAERLKHAAYNRDYDRRNPDRKADTQLKGRLGLPHGTYARMLAEQNGKCAICGTTTPGSRLTRFHVDHDASTGKVRGLLCERCNRGIGSLLHSVAIISLAIHYLNLHDHPKDPVFDAVLSMRARNC